MESEIYADEEAASGSSYIKLRNPASPSAFQRIELLAPPSREVYPVFMAPCECLLASSMRPMAKETLDRQLRHGKLPCA